MREMGLFNESESILCANMIKVLQEEFLSQYKNGLYGFIQRNLTYASNHLEGSTLTKDQTSLLFDTQTLTFDGDVIRSKDVEEAQGHFLAFNHLIKTIDDTLSVEMIKAFHYCLKAGVFYDRLNGNAVGEFKTRPNIAGDTQTCLPAEVPDAMNILLEWYSSEPKTLQTIVEFHSRFEKIHPFQDGNGRVGRLIIFRECLKNDTCPVIIEEVDRLKYIKALKSSQQGDNTALVEMFKGYQNRWREQYLYFLK